MINSIQYLRAFAALAVVVYHTNATAIDYFKSKSVFDWLLMQGYLGVDVFFAISGFIISYMVIRQGQNRKKFIYNRIVRIVPPYWILTIFLCLLFLAVPSLFRQLSVTPANAGLSLLFLSWIQNEYPVMNVGWTLQYEVIFYAAVSILYPHFFKINGRILLPVIAVIAVTPFFSGSDGSDNSLRNALFFLQFISGIVIFLVYNKKLSIWNAAGLFSMIVLVELAWGAHRVLAGNLLGVVLLSAGLSIESAHPEKFRNKLILKVGDASYATYLIQTFTIPTLAKLATGYLVIVTFEVYLFLAPVFTLAVGFLFYRFVETRFCGYSKWSPMR